jgi:adenosylcobinamide kinase/adenosylcobinamide-phosphate guanylyltransferase
MPRLILISGPARSGKSELAEALATATEKSVIYIATAQVDPEDQEWQARISQHQQRRPDHWQTLAVPQSLAPVLQAASSQSCLLVDSLGTWVANFLELEESAWQETCQDLRESLATTAADVIFVAEEVGWGVVPAYPLGRKFRDRLGNLTRWLGAIANPVYLVANGYVLDLKHLGTPLSEFLSSPCQRD